MPGLHDAVLVGFVRREQGLAGARQSEAAAEPGRRSRAGREDGGAAEGAGAQILLDVLLTRTGASLQDLRRLEPPCLTGPDLASWIRAGTSRLRRRHPRRGRIRRARFRAAVWENFDLADAAAQLFPPGDAGADRLPQRASGSTARRRADRLRSIARGADPVRGLTLTPCRRTPNSCKETNSAGPYFRDRQLRPTSRDQGRTSVNPTRLDCRSRPPFLRCPWRRRCCRVRRTRRFPTTSSRSACSPTCHGPSSAADGPGSVTAAQMAVDDFGGTVLGKPIQLISADHQIKPDIAAGIARQWYDRDQVDLIVDVPVSAVGLRCRTSPTRRKKLLHRPLDRHRRFPRQVLYALRLAVGVRHPRACGRHGAGSHQARRRQLVLPHRRLCVRPCAGTRRLGRRSSQNGGKVLGSVSHPLRHAGSLVVHSAGAGLEGKDHRHRRGPARQHQRDQDSAASSAFSRAASRWPACWC